MGDRAAICGHDESSADGPGRGQPGGAKVVAVPQPVRHERDDLPPESS